MDLQEFLTTSTDAPIELAALTALAGDRRAFGDDLVTAFATQAELRGRRLQAILDGATEAERDLLASERREFDRTERERDAVLGLQRQVEQRTAQAAYVPASQRAVTVEPDDELSPVLTRDQRVTAFLGRRGNLLYAGEPGAKALRFGRIVRALALGDRRNLSPLEQRVLSEGTDGSGGYTVPEILGGQLIDRVRNAMAVMRAGAQTVPMTSDTLHLARLGQPDSVSPTISTASWKAENDDVTETDLALERVTFTARTLPVVLKLSVELSEDSVNIDQAIETELSQQLALELDRAALLGSGSAPEPKGIRNQSGVGVTDYGSTAPTDYDFLVEAIGRVWTQNHEPNARIYNASLATAIAKFKSSVDSQPLRAPDVVAAVPAFRTNQIPDAGSSPDSTTLFVGDFTQLMIGLRTSFRLEMSRVAGDAFSKLQIWVRAYLRADVQLAHPEAFDVTTSVGI